MAREFTYPVLDVVRVHDGDTCTLLVDMGFHLQRVISIRIQGIDTPELRGTSLAAARLARDLAKTWLVAATEPVLVSRKLDKYGRVLGDIVDRDTNDTLAEYLLIAGVAHRYDGGTKTPWTVEECQLLVETIR